MTAQPPTPPHDDCRPRTNIELEQQNLDLYARAGLRPRTDIAPMEWRFPRLYVVTVWFAGYCVGIGMTIIAYSLYLA